MTTARQFDLVVVGDANPDLILRGDLRPRFGQVEQLLDAADLVLGGSAAIVAAGAARLGLATGIVSRVGADQFGESVVAQLRERGVDVQSITRDPAYPTGLTVVLAEPDDRAILTLLGAIPTLRPKQVTDEVLTSTRHVHVAAYFLHPHLAAGLPQLFARAHRAGCTTSLDTNWDPAERWDGVREALVETDVFLPNTAELLAVASPLASTSSPSLPCPDEEQLALWHDAAAKLAVNGTLVVVKAGERGAFAVGAAARASAPALQVDVVDTTGAGDSFDAGFLTAWLEGRPLTQCVQWAAAAGSLSTRAAGGTEAQATVAEVMQHAEIESVR